MSAVFPHFYYPRRIAGVGRRFPRGKLSTVVPARFTLYEQAVGQKNFCPTYPRGVGLFPPGYPRIYPQPIADVENLGEKQWIMPEKSPQ